MSPSSSPSPPSTPAEPVGSRASRSGKRFVTCLIIGAIEFETMIKRRVFITGATGFSGRHLMASLPPLENIVYGTAYPQPPHPDEKNILLLDLGSEREVFEAA